MVKSCEVPLFHVELVESLCFLGTAGDIPLFVWAFDHGLRLSLHLPVLEAYPLTADCVVGGMKMISG